MDSLNIPKLIHGSTSLGNIYKVVDYKTKLDIVRNMFAVSEDGTVMIDTAGKYGAGLALESIGKALAELKIDPAKVIISNKLAWIR